MGRIIRVSVAHRQSINQAIIFAARVPSRVKLRLQEPGALVRGFRSALRMSQAQLARRCGLPRAHITRLEGGLVDAQMSTLRRVFDALFCDLMVLPLPRKRPGDAVAEKKLEGFLEKRMWD